MLKSGEGPYATLKKISKYLSLRIYSLKIFLEDYDMHILGDIQAWLIITEISKT